MRNQPKTVWQHPKYGRIEKSGSWFVAYGLDGNKLGAKKGYHAALKAYFGIEPY